MGDSGADYAESSDDLSSSSDCSTDSAVVAAAADPDDRIHAVVVDSSSPRIQVMAKALRRH